MKKISIYNLLFLIFNILFFYILNFKSRNYWTFQFLLFIWILALILVIFLISFAIRTYFVSIKLWSNLLLTYLLAYPVVTLFIVSLSSERINFFNKVLRFYKEVDNFKYLTVPYILSMVITLILYLIFNKTMTVKKTT